MSYAVIRWSYNHQTVDPAYKEYTFHIKRRLVSNDPTAEYLDIGWAGPRTFVFTDKKVDENVPHEWKVVVRSTATREEFSVLDSDVTVELHSEPFPVPPVKEKEQKPEQKPVAEVPEVEDVEDEDEKDEVEEEDEDDDGVPEVESPSPHDKKEKTEKTITHKTTKKVAAEVVAPPRIVHHMSHTFKG